MLYYNLYYRNVNTYRKSSLALLFQRRGRSWLCFFIFNLFIFASTANACTVIDDTGTTIHTTHPAQRIISLAPDITETLFAIGAGQQVVGVMQGSDYPARATTLPTVGNYRELDLEHIVTLHPDLIITWSHTFARQLSALKALGIPVYTTEPHRLEDIPHTMQQLGCLTGTTKTAEQVAKQFSLRLSQLRAQYQHQKPVAVFYQIGSYSLITLNQDSWVNQVIVLCGGRNVFAQAKIIAPEVSWEAAVAANPEAIINSSKNDQWQANWQRWSSVPAVKNHYLFTINPDLLERAGPRLLDGTIAVCKALQTARL